MALLGAPWSLMAFSVIPVMVIENKGVVESMKASVALFKRTWGESIVGQVGIGYLFMLLGLVSGLVYMVLLIFAFFTGNWGIFFAPLALLIIWIAALSIVMACLQGIIVAALYEYATTGAVLQAFDPDLIKGAFKQEIKGGII
jgi:hypothetical protein